MHCAYPHTTHVHTHARRAPRRVHVPRARCHPLPATYASPHRHLFPLCERDDFPRGTSIRIRIPPSLLFPPTGRRRVVSGHFRSLSLVPPPRIWGYGVERRSIGIAASPRSCAHRACGIRHSRHRLAATLLLSTCTREIPASTTTFPPGTSLHIRIPPLPRLRRPSAPTSTPDALESYRRPLSPCCPTLRGWSYRTRGKWEREREWMWKPRGGAATRTRGQSCGWLGCGC
ncbi:hypothetical protein C8J57DRAFT_555454 [Mycena rebaudengoi]|nr:hypothetical protein C8J57DRAFT_555454 [Mycena rebaudengoi]